MKKILFILIISLASCTKTVTVEVEKKVEIPFEVVKPEPRMQYIRIEYVDANDSLKTSTTLNLE